MKVLHVIPSLSENLDGPANAIGKMCKGLVVEGVDITIYTTDLHPINYDSLKGLEVRVFKTFKKSNYCFSAGLWLTLKKNISQYDIVHIHALWVFPSTIAAYLSRKKKVPYIIRTCGMLDYYSVTHDKWKHFKKRLYFNIFERHNLNLASAIHFTSLEEQKRTEHLNIKSSSLILPVGVEIGEFIDLPAKGCFRARYPFLKDKKIILFLGRIHYKKGLEILLDAYKRISDRTDKAHLVIAGPDNDGYEEHLKKKVSKLELNDKVLFTGLVKGKQKIEAFTDADVFCLPSFQENFGIAVVEAMAAQLPVVISDQVNIHAEISDAKAGFVTPCDPEEVADAIMQIISNDTLKGKMGLNARQLVFNKFSWDRIAKKMTENYQRIIQEYKSDESPVN
ncbi:MAG: glycosyltransferase [Nitrospirae bacterium]|nr:glycosyltransferase [Nitrospirota bacterium]